MFVRQGVCVGLLLCASLALAQDDNQRSAPGVRSNAPSTTQAASSTTGPQRTEASATIDQAADLDLALDEIGNLVPRQPFAKGPEVFRTAETSGRIIVKFMDSVSARALNDGTMTSTAGFDTTMVAELAERLGLTFEPAIKLAENKLVQLQLRAAVQSGVAQPDLAGIIYVDGPADALEEAAPILLGMAIVEYVEFEPQWELDVGPPANDDCANAIEVFDGVNGPFSNVGAALDGPEPGDCGPETQMDNDVWFTYNSAITGFVTVDLCAGSTFDTVLAVYQGCTCPADTADLLTCADNGCALNQVTSRVTFSVQPMICYLIQVGGDDGAMGSITLTVSATSLASCANILSGSCFDADGNGSPGCYNISNETCCADVCFIIPDCCAMVWDEFCAESAAVLCTTACGHPGSGDCFDANGSEFCDDQSCCELICAFDPGCCDPDLGWDEVCVDLASILCDGVCNANAGSCFEEHASAGCNDSDCCDIVCAVDPDCCAFGWDTECAQIAQFACDEPTGCPSVGSCFEPHGSSGCEDASCCELVCTADPLCCDLTWDDDCVTLATELCTFSDDGPTPDFTSLQGYRSLITGGYNLEGSPLDPYDGIYGLGQFAVDVLGRGQKNGARGRGIKVGVIEFSALLNHEDLKDSDGKRVVNLDPDVKINDMYLLNASWNNHGTATLGEIAGVENDFGITGIAPDAEPWFFPIVTIDGGREFDAWTNALTIFGTGDVLSASYGPVGCGTLATSPTMWTLFRTASDLGITVCISAGNDCCNLEDEPQADGDSGAIIVGAGFPRPPWCRLGFSNFHKSPNSGVDTEQVHLQAWGSEVTTLGYGNLFLGDGSFNRSYTTSFGGTSSAAPMVAGLVTNMQGFATQFHGIPLMPVQIRAILTACPGGPTFPQCLIPFCDESLMPGAPDFPDPPPPECIGDIDPDGDPNVIGPFSEARGAGLSIITGGFFGQSPGLGDIEVLRGTLLFGNANSVKASDDNRLVIKSQFTEPTANIHLGIVYLATGQITDVMLTATANPNLGTVTSLAIAHEGHVTNGSAVCPPVFSVTGMVFYEMFDWVVDRWAFAAFDNMLAFDPGSAECPIPLNPVAAPARFVRAGDRRMLLRIWTLSLGGNFGGFGGAGAAPYVVRHDWINIIVGGLGDGSPGDGD